jgi:hypothetical protein
LIRLKQLVCAQPEPFAEIEITAQTQLLQRPRKLNPSQRPNLIRNLKFQNPQ